MNTNKCHKSFAYFFGNTRSVMKFSLILKKNFTSGQVFSSTKTMIKISYRVFHDLFMRYLLLLSLTKDKFKGQS